MDIFLYTFAFCTFITPLLFPHLIFLGHAFLWVIIPAIVLHLCKQTEWYYKREHKRQEKKDKENADKRQRELEIELKAMSDARADKWKRSGYVHPTIEQFAAMIRDIYKQHSPNLELCKEFLSPIIEIQQNVYLYCTPVVQDPADFKRTFESIIYGFGKGLADFTKIIGAPLTHRRIGQKNASIFRVVRSSREYVFNPDGSLKPKAKQAYEALAAPLKNVNYEHVNLDVSVRWMGSSVLTEDYNSTLDRHWLLVNTPYRNHAKQLYADCVVTDDIDIPTETRFAGTWIVAPPGRGKTNLLHNMIAEDLKKTGTLILMDSKGDLINSYRGYSDVVLIEPATVAINPLQLGTSTRSLEFLEYIFSALLETAMTPLQKTLFRSVLTLLLKVPNATLETFRQILTTGWKPFESYVLQCDRSTQDFFMAKPAEFDGPTYKETKQQVLWRLRLILSNEYLQQIFTSPVSNVDFFALLDSGQLVIIDNSKDVLGEEGAEFFGRFFVAVIWMAAVSRSKLRPEQKVPVYCYIDEAHTVIKRDDKIATILDECRSQKIALIMAHQRIAQIVSPNVLDALGNCAIRIANSDDDAAALAPRFRTEPQSLRVPVGQFALFVRDVTPNAVTVTVPLFDMTAFPPPPPPRFGEPHRGGPQSAAPPDDRAYDQRYDLLWSQNLSPTKARDGTVMTIILPSRRTHLQPIPAGAKNGYRFCVKGQSGILRPDGSFGNLWVELEIADLPGANATDVRGTNTKEDF